MNRRLNAMLGCFTVVVIVCIFSIEGTLALLRQRNVEATLEIQNAAGVTATPTPEPTPGGAAQSTPAPGSNVLTMAVDETLVVHVHWDYRIGPRFPDTTIQAIAQDSNNQIVASNSYMIQCGAETINCSGDQRLPLNFGVKDSSGTAANWPAGTYTVVVTSAIADLKPTQLLATPFTVTAQSSGT